MAKSGKSMGGGANAQHGAKGAGRAAPGAFPDQFERAQDIAGANSLQGEDQARRRNQRGARAGASGRTEGVKESFAKMDRKARGGRTAARKPAAGKAAASLADAEDAVRRRAYALWEEEGRPHGRDREHWERAEREVGPTSSDEG